MEEEGRRRDRGWSAARGRLTSPAKQGKVPRARSPVPSPRPRAPGPPALARAQAGLRPPREGEGPAAAPRARRRGAPAAGAVRGSEAGVHGVPRGSRRVVGAAPLSLASGSGGLAGWRGARASARRWRTPRAACGVGEPCGRRQSRRGRPATTRAAQKVGAGEEKKRLRGDGRDTERGWAVLPPGVQVLSGDRGQGGEQFFTKGQLGVQRPRRPLRESGSERVRVCGVLTLGGGAEGGHRCGVGAGALLEQVTGPWTP